jgi:hypothetical protein
MACYIEHDFPIQQLNPLARREANAKRESHCYVHFKYVKQHWAGEDWGRERNRQDITLEIRWRSQCSTWHLRWQSSPIVGANPG